MQPLVFITGASSGIGQALALRFYQAGFHLALLARRTTEVEQWREHHQLDPQRTCIYQADVTDTPAVIAAAEQCIATQGLPTVVIANAGISIGIDTAMREDLDVMAHTLAVNTLGMATTFHPFITPMRTRGTGTLVGIGSVAGIRGLPGHGAYCASKAAVISYCEALRGELAPHGVGVVTLCPGYIDTPLTQQNRYAMPFLMQPADFADQAFQAIQAQTRYRTIPWQMGVVSTVLRWLPNAWFDRLLRNRPRKHRGTIIR